ncbi:MAG: lytic transglycosylase domain-containing protein [bacterium]|nr:lytic transglycosylase domain-containing protein [bacterium]
MKPITNNQQPTTDVPLGHILRTALVLIFLLSGWWVATGTAATHIDKAREYAACGLLDKALTEYRAALEDNPADKSLRSEMSGLEYRVLRSRLPINNELTPVDAVSRFGDYRGSFAEWSGTVKCLLQSDTRVCQVDTEDVTVNLIAPVGADLSPGKSITFIVKIPYARDKNLPEIVAVTAQAPARMIPVKDDAGALRHHAVREDYEEYRPQEVVAANDPPVKRSAARHQPVKAAKKTSVRSTEAGSKRNDRDKPGQGSSAGVYIKAYAAAARCFNSRLSEKDAEQIADYVLRYSAQYSVDPRLIMAVVAVESGFKPAATSPAGAAGLGQLMPATAAGLGITNRYDPAQSIWGAVRILKGHMDKWTGKGKDIQHALALACYNAGPGAVSRYGGVPPYRETQNYIQKVMSLYNAFCGAR